MVSLRTTTLSMRYGVVFQNPAFSAAGIAYDTGEAEQFAHPDGRPKRWYAVPKAKLIEIEPSVEKALGEIHRQGG